MRIFSPYANLVFAWLWIALGFLSGSVMGLKFDQEHWLGGYDSYRRRLIRLGHISFFGLAIINALFFFTSRGIPEGAFLSVSSAGFVIGGVTMPLVCFATAHNFRLKPLFVIPVLSLVVSGIITFWLVAEPLK